MSSSSRAHKFFTLAEANRTLPLVRRVVQDIMAAHPEWYLRELEEIGCEFKDFEKGLVDFHGRLEGREILWCWKSGEDRIAHWHELEAGYAGRQPLPEVLSRT